MQVCRTAYTYNVPCRQQACRMVLTHSILLVWFTVLTHSISCRYGVLYSHPVYILQVWCTVVIPCVHPAGMLYTNPMCTSCRYGVLYLHTAYPCRYGVPCILQVWCTVLIPDVRGTILKCGILWVLAHYESCILRTGTHGTLWAWCSTVLIPSILQLWCTVLTHCGSCRYDVVYWHTVDPAGIWYTVLIHCVSCRYCTHILCIFCRYGVLIRC
jgi:hypothetical protein